MKINSMFIINKLIKSVLGNDRNSINYVAIATHLHYGRPVINVLPNGYIIHIEVFIGKMDIWVYIHQQ
jgi:hypothetical protein